MATRPKDSLYEGMTSTDAARNQSASWSWPTGGWKRTTSRDAEAGGQLLQALRLGEAAAARAADDRHDEPGAQRRGRSSSSSGDRAQQDVGGLQRLDAAREERDQGVLRQAEAGAGGGAAVGGPEAVEVHAGVDDGDLAGVGVVVADELVGLLGGVGDEPVGGARRSGSRR